MHAVIFNNPFPHPHIPIAFHYVLPQPSIMHKLCLNEHKSTYTMKGCRKAKS